MANGKAKGNKIRGGKKSKGRTSTSGARTVSVNPDIKAARLKNPNAYTTKQISKKKAGTGKTTTNKRRRVSKGKTSASAGRSYRPRTRSRV